MFDVVFIFLFSAMTVVPVRKNCFSFNFVVVEMLPVLMLWQILLAAATLVV
jgi:hypothetical protein